MTTPDKDKVASSTPADMEAAAEAAASVAAGEGAHDAEVVADAEVIEANEAGKLDDELERAAAEAERARNRAEKQAYANKQARKRAILRAMRERRNGDAHDQ